MIGINWSTSIFFYKTPCDMRKSFNGLCGLVINVMKKNPQDDCLFVFVNKKRTHIKILYWECHGFWLFYKRLEKGTFNIPTPVKLLTSNSIEMKYEELMLLIRGIDFSSLKRRKWLS